MKELINAIILGVVQGLTEFLPISSSGHLEIAKFLLRDESMAQQSLMMTVVVHAATAISTLYVLRKDVFSTLRGLTKPGWNEDWKFTYKIVLSMIPAAILGILFASDMEVFFDKNLTLVGSMLLITGLLLFLADRAVNTEKSISTTNALMIGIAQAIAILPGISRSGATISTSVLLGIDRDRAARFSFLMVVPLILGKMVHAIIEGDLTSQNDQFLPLTAAFITAFLTGCFACKLMIKLVKDSKLTYFSVYCFIVGFLSILLAQVWAN